LPNSKVVNTRMYLDNEKLTANFSRNVLGKASVRAKTEETHEVK